MKLRVQAASEPSPWLLGPALRLSRHFFLNIHNAMPLFLKKRDPNLKEWMEDPECDLKKLHATYDQFGTINYLLGGWPGIYKHWIRPALKSTTDIPSVLDVGCGGGDILRMLHSFTETDQIETEFTGIEPDKRAVQYLNQQRWPANFSFKNTDSSDLARQGRTYTIVISNHLIHHLTQPNLEIVCSDVEKLADKLVLFNDIERSDIGYAFFSTLAPVFFKRSFIADDGAISIRRSYRKSELQPLLHAGWKVKRQFPFRLLAIHEPEKT